MIIANSFYLENKRLQDKVQFFLEQEDSKFPFFNRTPIVDMDSEQLLDTMSFRVDEHYSSLLNGEDELELVHDASHVFGTKLNHIPRIKIGYSLTYDIMRKMLVEDSDSKAKEEEYERLAESIALGIKQTLNYLSLAMMLNGVVYDRMGMAIASHFGTPEDLSMEVGSRNTLLAIKTLCKTAKDKYGKVYDRATMSTDMLKEIYGGTTLYKDAEQSDKLIETLTEAFEEETKLNLELYDGTFKIKLPNGTTSDQSALPKNKIILSFSSDDGDSNLYAFGNVPATELLAFSLINNVEYVEQFGAIAYFTGNTDLNPPEVKAWGVISGFPVLWDKYAFAQIKINEDFIQANGQ